MASNPVLHILEKTGLRNLLENFQKQNITNVETCKQLTDTDLSILGLTTIGDRARFRAEVKESVSCTSPTTLTNQAGKRGEIDLGMVLKFVTGVEKEPPLGFWLTPSITFMEAESYLPTANTCSNKLTLPLPTSDNKLPDDELLFKLFDYAFCNSYFGLV